jgi:hypothetical protein
MDAMDAMDDEQTKLKKVGSWVRVSLAARLISLGAR